MPYRHHTNTKYKQSVNNQSVECHQWSSKVNPWWHYWISHVWSQPRVIHGFHAVSFGLEGSLMYLCCMANIALNVENNVPRDPLMPASVIVPLSYMQALDMMHMHISWFPGYMHTNQHWIYIMLSPTCADVPEYCRIVAKAKRGTDTMRWMFWHSVCDVNSPVHLIVVRYMHDCIVLSCVDSLFCMNYLQLF